MPFVSAVTATELQMIAAPASLTSNNCTTERPARKSASSQRVVQPVHAFRSDLVDHRPLQLFDQDRSFRRIQTFKECA
jgi:hypothetical protein